MSCYHCEECGELYDDDENVGHQSPTDDGLVCEDCFAEIEGDLLDEQEHTAEDQARGLAQYRELRARALNISVRVKA